MKARLVLVVALLAIFSSGLMVGNLGSFGDSTGATIVEAAPKAPALKVLGFYTKTSSFNYSSSGAGGGAGSGITCNAGDTATSGGFSVPTNSGLEVVESRPNGNGWFVVVRNTVGGSWTIETFVRCAKLAS